MDETREPRGADAPERTPQAETRPAPEIPAAPQRALLGGFLMGLANLVPGVSGGTMILAIGLYDRFIAAISDVTRLRWNARSLVFLMLVAVGGVLAIGLLSGFAVGLVVEHRWIMYALFVGMTLGGVPELWTQCRPPGRGVAVGALVGFGAMAALAWGTSTTQIPGGTAVYVVVGAIAASSMILPGVSGSYLLLVLGMYETVVGSVSATLHGDRAEGLAVLAPVVVGAGLGVALLSNVLRLALQRAPRVSHAVLLGLLCGSVLGLWPFQESAHPELVDRATRDAAALLNEGEGLGVVNRRLAEEGYALVLDAERAEELRAKYDGLGVGELKLRSEDLVRFVPTLGQVAVAVALLVVGGALTRLLGRREHGK